MTATAKRSHNRMELVLDAAAELFASKGFKETTTRDIASAANMLPGSIYYHFATKEALLLAVYREGVRRMSERVEEELRQANGPWERFSAMLKGHLESLLERTPYGRVLIRVLPESAPSIAKDLIALRDQYEKEIRHHIEALPLPDHIDRNLLRLFIIGAANHTHVWHKPGGQSPAEIARELTCLIRSSVEGPAS